MLMVPIDRGSSASSAEPESHSTFGLSPTTNTAKTRWAFRDLAAWFSALPGSQRIFAVGLVVCIVGGAIGHWVFPGKDSRGIRSSALHRRRHHHRRTGHIEPGSLLLLLKVIRRIESRE